MKRPNFRAWTGLGSSLVSLLLCRENSRKPPRLRGAGHMFASQWYVCQGLQRGQLARVEVRITQTWSRGDWGQGWPWEE